jgi:hypothetical protein
VRAAPLLARAGFDTPALRVALYPVRPERVQVWPAGPLLRAVWREGISAMTLGRWVFVDPKVLRGDPESLGRLIVHELVHVRQFSDLGLVGFFVRYLADYARGRLRGLNHREAYRQNLFEEEARQSVDRLT